MGTNTGISSRERILSSGKTLFAKHGYENTSTVAIAREAATSESQLMKHFGSKLGLLSAVCEQGWANVMQRARALSNGHVTSPQSVVEVLECMTVELDRDPEMKSVLILESRRLGRNGSEASPVQGSAEFEELLENLLTELKNQGSLPSEMNVKALRAALYGMTEGMILENVIATRSGDAPSYESDEVRSVLEALVSALIAEPVVSHHALR